jgi:hypothetical protein
VQHDIGKFSIKIRIWNNTNVAYVKVISQHSSGGTDEYPARLLANRAEIRAWYFLNSDLRKYRYITDRPDRLNATSEALNWHF